MAETVMVELSRDEARVAAWALKGAMSLAGEPEPRRVAALDKLESALKGADLRSRLSDEAVAAVADLIAVAAMGPPVRTSVLAANVLSAALDTLEEKG